MNLILFGPLVFAYKLLAMDLLARAVAAFFAFCFISSAIYLINDVMDVEADRQHPEKQTRPLASGQVSVAQALTGAIVLAAAGLGLGFAVNFSVGLVAAGYGVLHNVGDAAVTVTGVESADFGSASLHKSTSSNGMEHMQALGDITLTVDGLDVWLAESADGRNIIVTGVAGRLSPDLYRREQQVRALLKANLGMLQSSKAGLRLESADETATAPILRGFLSQSLNSNRDSENIGRSRFRLLASGVVNMPLSHLCHNGKNAANTRD